MKKIELKKYNEEESGYPLTLSAIDNGQDKDVILHSDIIPIEIGSLELKDTPDLFKINEGESSPYWLNAHLISQDNRKILVIHQKRKILGEGW